MEKICTALDRDSAEGSYVGWIDDLGLWCKGEIVHRITMAEIELEDGRIRRVILHRDGSIEPLAGNWNGE